MADTIIPWLLGVGPIGVVGYFVLRAVIDPSRLTRKPSGPRWRPGYIGLADSGGGIDSGVPDAATGFGDGCGHGSDGGSHGDCGGHGGDGGGSH